MENEVVNELEETTNNEPNIEEEVSLEEKTDEEELEQQDVQEDEEQEEEEESSEEVPEYTKSQVKKMMEKRLGRMSNSYQKKEERLLSVLKAGGFEGNNLDELTEELISNYKEEGIEIPEYHSSANLTDREQEALAKLDAEEVIEMGELAMENRFAELYEKENRTIREEKEMEMIGKEASLKNARKELVKAGYDPDVLLKDENFIEFASEMSSDVPIQKILKYYERLKGTLPEKPKSTGSIKSKGGASKVKDYYTYEEANQFTRKQLDENPELVKAIENSMAKW